MIILLKILCMNVKNLTTRDSECGGANDSASEQEIADGKGIHVGDSVDHDDNDSYKTYP